MKVNALHIRPGNILEHQGKHWVVLKNTVLQPGKGGAFAQVEMRDLKSGIKSNQRWRTQEAVEKAEVRTVKAGFLYAQGDTLHFMNNDNYEQFTVAAAMLGEGLEFLQEGMECEVSLIEGTAAAVVIPQTVTLEVSQTDPVVKRQTATSSYKPAVLANGTKIMVPPHIEIGMRVVINTESGAYLEREK